MTVGPAWLALTNAIISSGWEAIADHRTRDLFGYVAVDAQTRLNTDLSELFLWEGLSGDQGSMEHSLLWLFDKLRSAKPLSAADYYGLAAVLARIIESPQAIQAAAGVKNRRGGSKKGSKSMEVALDVLLQLTHGKAHSFGEAWAATAAKLHVSEGLAQKYWTDRRESLLKVIRQPLGVTAAQIVQQSIEQGFRS